MEGISALKQMYIKSPINYTGNKYKLLEQVVPLFPKGMRTFVDVFGGSGTVCLNADATRLVYNEYAEYVYDMFKGFVETKYDEIIERIDQTIKGYGLTKTNEEGYIRLRNDYNEGRKDWVTLYVLCCYAFNSQGRFGINGKFNMPFGKNRSCFSDVQRDNISKMKDRISGKRVLCTNLSFDAIDYSAFGKGDFVYFDPPYLGSVAVYNEKNGWTEKQERTLVSIIDALDARGVWFGLSNNLKYGNPMLEDLCERYTVHHLGSKYNNSSYHKIDKVAADDEVFVTNYKSSLDKKLF